MYRLREELTSVTADLEESQREKIKKVTSLQSSVRTLKSELESREIRENELLTDKVNNLMEMIFLFKIIRFCLILFLFFLFFSSASDEIIFNFKD